MKLAGQVALVTGGSRGIGRATALAFAAEGADVAFCHLDDGTQGRGDGERDPCAWAACNASIARCGRHRCDPCLRAGSRCGTRPDRHPVQQRRHEHPQAVRGLHGSGLRPDPGCAHEGHVLHGAGGVPGDGGARERLHHQRGLAARAEGRGELGAILRGEGGDHRLHPRAGLRGDAAGRASECGRAGPDRHRSDRDDGARRPPGVHRRAAGASLRPPRGDRRDRAAVGRPGWWFLCRRDAVAEWRGRDVLKTLPEATNAVGTEADLIRHQYPCLRAWPGQSASGRMGRAADQAARRPTGRGRTKSAVGRNPVCRVWPQDPRRSPLRLAACRCGTSLRSPRRTRRW